MENNEMDLKSKKRKSNKGLISLIIILILIILGLAGFITYDKVLKDKYFDKKETKEVKKEKSKKESQTTDNKQIGENSIKLKDTTITGQTAKQAYNVNINGKESYLNIDLKYEFKEYDSGDKYHYIKGYLNQKQIFDAVYDGSLKEYAINELMNKENINKIFNESNFKLIDGKDNKKYILMYGAYGYIGDSGSLGNSYDLLYVLNDKYEFIQDNTVKSNIDYEQEYLNNAFVIHRGTDVIYQVDNGNPWFEDIFNICSKIIQDDSTTKDICKVFIKVNKDSIDYLYTSYTTTGDPIAKVEERNYTISDNKLSYTSGKTYTTNKVINQSR